jgi:hypothetical protein
MAIESLVVIGIFSSKIVGLVGTKGDSFGTHGRGGTMNGGLKNGFVGLVHPGKGTTLEPIIESDILELGLFVIRVVALTLKYEPGATPNVHSIKPPIVAANFDALLDILKLLDEITTLRFISSLDRLSKESVTPLSVCFALFTLLTILSMFIDI